MKIIFQKNKILYKENFEKFSKLNSHAGAVLSFIGKVRPTNCDKSVTSIDIEIYEKMATTQMEKIIIKLNAKYKILDHLIIHRYGKIYPGENIVAIFVCSKHRKEAFRFLEETVDWLKVKITFWKKENYTDHSEWVEQKKKDKEFVSD